MRTTQRLAALGIVCTMVGLVTVGLATAQEAPKEQARQDDPKQPTSIERAKPGLNWTGDWLFQATPTGSVPLQPRLRVWRDPERKLVIMDGEVCLREGPLELFACPRNTKEHESVVVVDAVPGVVHAGLVAVGAKAGSPASFNPYRPVTGTQIQVIVAWADEDGKRHAVPAQQWIKNTQTGKIMQRNWVFAGSRWISDEATGRRSYLADGGDFICVSNFSSAMLDLPVQSSQENSSLLFEANTEAIPKVGTKVRLVLMPETLPIDGE